MNSIKNLAVLFLLTSGQLCFAADGAKAKINDVSFLVGSFKGSVFGSPGEAHFMAPSQGKILGVGRIISPDPNQDFAELTQIEESNGTLLLRPMPNGVDTGVTFTATTVESKKVVFDNNDPKHLFPARITYQLQDDGGLFTRVEGQLPAGKPVVMEYVESRVIEAE